MDPFATVYIEPLNGYPNTYRLAWEPSVREADVHPAFAALTDILNHAAGPVHIVLDLTCDPNIPLSLTTQEAFSGPFRHPNLGSWLVVGANWRARMIADVISQVGPGDNIRWFGGDAEAVDYLNSLQAR